MLKRSRFTNQEPITTALDPTVIASKKKIETEKKKLQIEHQESVNIKMLNYIIAEARALCTVESVHFRNLLKEIDPRVEVFCVKTFKKLIAKKFIEFKVNLTRQFCSAKYVCLTADIWESNHRSFMG